MFCTLARKTKANLGVKSKIVTFAIEFEMNENQCKTPE